MGLDINIYSQCRLLTTSFNPDGEPVDTSTNEVITAPGWTVYVNPHFPARAAQLTDGGFYSYEGMARDNIGSYSLFNEWREKLAELAGYTPAPSELPKRKGEIRHDTGAGLVASGPFWELINFSDCEGTLDAATCRKLLNDFDQFADAACAANTSDWFARFYIRWHAAVRMASHDGFIAFT